MRHGALLLQAALLLFKAIGRSFATFKMQSWRKSKAAVAVEGAFAKLEGGRQQGWRVR